MQAGTRIITEIFNRSRILEIPFFQRAYVWDEPQWERLLEDMEHVSQTKKPYFLGSIILKQQETNCQAGVGDVRTVIDGQQRLTTLTIFLKVLCLKNHKNSLFDGIFRLLTDIDKITLYHNQNDIHDFETVVNLQELRDDLASHSKIIKAYTYFKDNIKEGKLDIQAILGNIMFVGIDLNAEEDEQQIFDTINSLGVKLTTGELLKNYFFDRNSLDSYNENWRSIFEADNECREYWDKEVTAGRIKRTNLELFFYSFLQIKLQDTNLKVKTEDKNEYGRFEGLFNSYKSFINKYKVSKTQMIDEIKEYALIYKEHIDLDVLERELPVEAGIERMNVIVFGLETSTVIPYILYVLKEADDKEKDKIFAYLESYIMRRMICRASTKNYNNLFSENLISNEILTEKALKDYLADQGTTVNYLPGNKELEVAFHTSKLTNKQSAGIIYMIESKVRKRNIQSTALLGISKYSLEHLMPKKWKNNWGALNNPDVINNRNNVLLTLGNLAIITAPLNSSIRDADWETKKIGRGEKKLGLYAYASGIETLQQWLDKEEWDEVVIAERATDLYNKAITIWPI